MRKDDRRSSRQRRHARIRVRVKGTPSRPRLSVFRSLNHVYAQVIDDSTGRTLVSASTLDVEIRSQADGKTKTSKSGLVGALVAKRALSKGISRVAFDRGGYQYHGRVKALGDAAREKGLEL